MEKELKEKEEKLEKLLQDRNASLHSKGTILLDVQGILDLEKQIADLKAKLAQ